MNSKDKVFQEDIAVITARINGRSSLSGKTILVAGGGGFMGSYLVSALTELNKNFKRPCKIISVDNYITSKKIKEVDDKEKNLVYITHDIKKQLKIRGKIDYIIHAAGIASPVYYKKYPLETLDVAVQGTRNLLDLAVKKKVKSFIFFSSSEIYGDPPTSEIPTKETFNGNVSCIGPRSCYDESKRLGETLCKTYFELYKVPIKIVRPFNIYGPKMNKNDFRVIPTMIKKALLGEHLTIHANGKQTRSFCYISDAIVGFFNILLSSRNGEVYNIGNAKEEINMNKLGKIISKSINLKSKVINVEYPKEYPADEPRRRCPDLTKIRREIGFEPLIDLEVGLKRTTEWCIKNWSL